MCPGHTLLLKMDTGKTMKISRLYALVVVVLLSSLAAFASSVNDPKVIIHGVDSGTNAPSVFAHCPPQGCTSVGMNFSFNVPQKGTGTLFFTNASGKNWTSLTLIESGVPAAAVSCSQALFLSCTVKTLQNGSVAIVLAGVKGAHNPQVGIPAGANFAITFACVNGGCWPKGLPFTGQAGAVPEPGTMALLITGVGAIFSRRKTWKNRWNS